MSPEGRDQQQPGVAVITADDFERRGREIRGEGVVAVVEKGEVAGLEPPAFEDPSFDRAARPAAAAVATSPAQITDKPDLVRRFAARAVDSALFALLAASSIRFVGPLVALAYLLLADGLYDGTSIGKRIFGLQVVRAKDRKPANIFDSLLRNAPLGIAGLFALIPLVGWALFLTLGLAVLMFETYMVVKEPHGARAGDILGGTVVIDPHQRGTALTQANTNRGRSREDAGDKA